MNYIGKGLKDIKYGSIKLKHILKCSCTSNNTVNYMIVQKRL